MRAAARFGKALQRGTYTLLNSKWGALLVLVVAMTLLNVALQIIDSSLGAHWVCMEYDDDENLGKYSNNIGGRSFEMELCEEPIDAVYTWVNGSEPQHQLEVAFWQLLQRREGNNAEDWLNTDGPPPTTSVPDASPNTTTNTSTSSSNHTIENRTSLSAQQLDDQSSRSRFEDHDELKYSLRSLEKYAGWVRHVYLVTNGQVPTWLNVGHPRITVVTHAEIFQNTSHLPTFSSPAIESHLHRIPGLSRRFLYLNDDTMFGAPVVPTDFYSKTKGHRLFYSWPVPQCSDGCPAAWLGDGTCDRQCNTTACDYDAGDCIGPNVKVIGSQAGHAAAPPSRGAAPKQSNVHCHSNCADGWIGDRYCDASCNHRDCGYDGLDCGLAPFEGDASFERHTIPWRRQDAPTGSMNRSTGATAHEGVATKRNDEEPRAAPLVVRLHHRIRVDVASTKAFLVNFSAVFPQGSLRAKILSGEFDTPSWIRAATIAQAPRLMVVSIVQEWGRFAKTCQFVIEGERAVEVLGGSKEASDAAAQIARKADKADARPPKSADGTTSAPAVDVETVRVKIFLNVTLFNASHNPHNCVDDDVVGGSAPHATTTRSQVLLDSAEEEPAGTLEAHDMEEAPTATTAPAAAATGHRLMQAAIDSAERAAAWRPLLAWDEEGAADEGTDDGGTVETSAPPTTSSQHHQRHIRQPASSPTQRRLMDLFGDSLKHTNMLVTRRFRSSSRRVPAHMVHMIDRQVMEELWDAWPEEWRATSASKFRSRSNLQYAFMHYYWMVHASTTLSGEEVFQQFVDVDGSGEMERREVRRVGLLLWEKEVAHGPLDVLAMGIVEGCERILRQPQEVDEPARSGSDSNSNSNDAKGGENRSTIAGATGISTSGAPTPTASPHAMGETRDIRVCQELWRVPGTDGFFRKLHPPPPPPPASITFPPDPTKATTTTAPAGEKEVGGGVDDGVSSAPSSGQRRNHSVVAPHGNRSTRYVVGGEHLQMPAPQQQQQLHQAVPPPVGLAGSSSRLPPVPAPYRVPTVNPEDKIKPMTEAFLDTVRWLLRAAAVGVAMHGNDTLPPPREEGGTWWPSVCGASSPFTLSSSDDEGPDCIPKEPVDDAASDPVPLTARTFASSHVGAIITEKYGTFRKYKVSVEELEDVTFVMVRNNRTVVRHQMDHVLFKRPKFLCVNDDMNHSSPEYGHILQTVDDMFRSYYPHPSQFELPNGRRNDGTRLAGGGIEGVDKTRSSPAGAAGSGRFVNWALHRIGRLAVAAGCLLLAVALLYACLTYRGMKAAALTDA